MLKADLGALGATTRGCGPVQSAPTAARDLAVRIERARRVEHVQRTRRKRERPSARDCTEPHPRAVAQGAEIGRQHGIDGHRAAVDLEPRGRFAVVNGGALFMEQALGSFLT